MKRWCSVWISLGAVVAVSAAQPNILWLTIEDTSAYEFGCYGNPDVRTPQVDALAEKGIQFMKAWSTAPHCSPARSTLITGCYATTYGMDNHRRRWDTPSGIFYPELMRKAGYFCTNNSKTDYNTTRNHKAMWDACGKTASYNSPKRKKDQPFFAVFNANITHMSRLTSVTLEGRRDFAKEGLDPAELTLPPHVPDLEAVRSDYAFHLEGVQDVDRWVGLHLAELEKRGLADDTIIFFYSDHGGCLPRGKGFPFESGLQVPLIVHLPEKYRGLADVPPGTRTDRLVGFVDFAPTLLSLAGIQAPDAMQGKAFMGQYETSPRTLQFAFRTNQERHYDPCRAVTDGRWKYIRSYLPNKPFGLRNDFQWQMPSNLAWDAYALQRRTPEAERNPAWLQPYEAKPAEMLFDLAADPFELNNLAGDRAHFQTLEKMRAALSEHIRSSVDLGFFPPSAKAARRTALYDWVRDSGYDHEALCAIAERASMPGPGDEAFFIQSLESPFPEIRFWAVQGLGRLGVCPDALKKAVADPDESVSAAAAGACVLGGFADLGMPVLLQGLKTRSGAEKDPFYSELETLSLHPAAAGVLEKFAQEIEQAGGYPAKSLAVNLGSQPVSSLYGSAAVKKGIQTNKNRRPLEPLP